MDRLTQMQVFVAVAEEEGFAAAARRLNLSPPVVTRAVAGLEERLGVKLLNRTTRHVRLTDAGKRYLEDCRRLLDEIVLADAAVAGINSAPRGLLSVTAPVMFGKLYVMPVILGFLDKYPETRVSAVFLDRVVNLLDEGMDVGVRIGHLPDSSMRAIRVGTVRHVLCASPDYIREYGLPKTPEDLKNHQIIAARNVSARTTLGFRNGEIVKVTPRLVFNNNEAALQAAIQGMGITRLISYQIAAELADGRLQLVLGEYQPDDMPISVVHRENQYASSKIRCFVDMAVEMLRANSALN